MLAGCSLQGTPTVTVQPVDGEEVTFDVQIADSREERFDGLQHAESLEENAGMWFVFDEPGTRAFWMRDTLISLDIIYVGENFEIVYIVNEAPPCAELDPEQNFCPSYASGGDALYVLEINGGLASEYGFQEGDLVTPNF